MSSKVMALNDKGEMTFCTVPPDLRGKGRCNHVYHQDSNESIEEFVIRVNSLMRCDDRIDDGVVDQQELINKLLSEYSVSFNKNPDWEDVIINQIPNHFVIGKGDTLEKANIEKVHQTPIINDNGDPVIDLKADIEFRGEVYEVDLGQIPEVQEDGTIIINGSKMRVLPVLAQTKSGIIRYRSKSVVRTDDGHVAFTHEPGDKFVKIKGEEVELKQVQNYLLGLDSSITKQQAMSLDKIDPVLYQRFPDIKENLEKILNDHKPDEANDLEWRKVYTYSDQVRFELSSQMRRMGVTFRTNLSRRAKAEEEGDKDKIEKAYSMPLFYQKNNTENILSELATRSNVQVADNLNPLSALSQSRKISLTGPGGYNKDKAPAILRQVNRSHKDKIDSLDISSGKNIGLTITLDGADVNEQGFIVKSDKPKMVVSDFIPYKHHNDLNRAAMATAHMKQAVPIVGGEDPRLLGDSSDSSWSQIKGSKIGTNLNVAYYASDGTHEDAVVISESAARKMMTVESNSYKFENSKKNSRELKEGLEVKRGDFIGGVKIKYNGVIEKVEDDRFSVRSEFKMGPGDKIAGRHGNKGVVSKVLPDNEMPQIDKGNGNYERAEILMSPLGVVGRMNLGQIYETNSGQLNKKTKMVLNNGRKVDSTSGEQFIMRLNHIAEKKLQYYSTEKGSDRESLGLRLGEMESLLLSSTKERRAVLNYLREQEGSDATNKLDSLLKSIGVQYRVGNENS